MTRHNHCFQGVGWKPRDARLPASGDSRRWHNQSRTRRSASLQLMEGILEGRRYWRGIIEEMTGFKQVGQLMPQGAAVSV